MLFEVRYRKPPAGTTFGVIEASSLERAQEVAQRWKDRESLGLVHHVRLITVKPFVLADESILEDAMKSGEEKREEVSSEVVVEKKKSWTENIKEKVSFG